MTTFRTMTGSEAGAILKQATPIAKALNAIGAATKRPLMMQSQGGRFRIQKAVYLLRRLGYPPAQKYAFSIYHMGPYSPDLAKAYYALEDDGIRGTGSAADIPAGTLATLTDAMSRSDRFLEGLSTLLDIWSQNRNVPAALSQARSVKPHLDQPTWREVRQFLTAHRDLITTT